MIKFLKYNIIFDINKIECIESQSKQITLNTVVNKYTDILECSCHISPENTLLQYQTDTKNRIAWMTLGTMISFHKKGFKFYLRYQNQIAYNCA